jgi:hypothetical protein
LFFWRPPDAGCRDMGNGRCHAVAGGRCVGAECGHAGLITPVTGQ